MSGFNFGTPNTNQVNPPAFGTQASAPSSGFSFGGAMQPNPAAASNVSFGTPKQSGFNFGSPVTSTTASSGFGMPITSQSQQSTSGFNFGTPTATVQPQQQLQQTSGVSFGTAQPQQQSTALSFGTNPSATTFGAPQAQVAPSFGSSQAQVAPSFGAPQAQVAPSFGAPQAQVAPSFGAQQQTQATPSFGVQQQTQAPPLFGTPAAQSTFGTPQTTIPTNTVQPLSFSTPASQPQTTGFSFGQQAAPAATTAASALSFSLPSSTPQTQQPATGFSFGQQQQTAQTTVSSAPSLGFGATSLTSSAAPTLSLNPLTTTPSSGISFGQPSTQAPPAFGASQTQQPSLLSSLTSQPLGATPLPTTSISNVTQSVGLGGIDMNTAQPKAVEGKSESTKVKETQVPKEIIQTVDDFKAYLKQQKTLSSDIIRTTDRKLKAVTDETQRLNCYVQEIANNVDNNKLAIKLLRSDTSKIIQQADMAQRTHETPSGLQFENIMPQIYFNELIHKYENDLLTLKHQVELTEKHLQTLSNPQNFSAQELKQGLRHIHESFIALAGRLQETHTKVDAQKEQFLSLRKFMLRDSTNVFEQESQVPASSAKLQFGPNPFTNSILGGGVHPSNQFFARQQQFSSQQLQTTNSSFFGNSSFGFKKM